MLRSTVSCSGVLLWLTAVGAVVLVPSTVLAQARINKEHGDTSELTDQELADLETYLYSL